MKGEQSLRLNNLRGILLGIEMNLKILEDDLGEIDKSLAYFNSVKNDLIYNINFHKSQGIITIVKEYKRSLDELRLVKLEIVKFTNFRNNLQKKMEQKLKSYDHYLSEYENIYNNLSIEATVLPFRKDEK